MYLIRFLPNFAGLVSLQNTEFFGSFSFNFFLRDERKLSGVKKLRRALAIPNNKLKDLALFFCNVYSIF